MDESRIKEELNQEIKKRNFIRAAMIAKYLDLPKDRQNQIRTSALWQMAAINRNPFGTKSLAIEFGYSRDEIKNTLQEYAQEAESRGDLKPLDPCYDYRTGKYLSFEEWLKELIGKWDKIQI